MFPFTVTHGWEIKKIQPGRLQLQILLLSIDRSGSILDTELNANIKPSHSVNSLKIVRCGRSPSSRRTYNETILLLYQHTLQPQSFVITRPMTETEHDG